MCRFGVLLFVWSVGVLCVEFEVCGVFVCSVQCAEAEAEVEGLVLALGVILDVNFWS